VPPPQLFSVEPDGLRKISPFKTETADAGDTVMNEINASTLNPIDSVFSLIIATLLE